MSAASSPASVIRYSPRAVGAAELGSGSRYPARTRSCRRRSKSCVVVSMLRPSAAATASTPRLAEASPSCPLIAFNSCMLLGPTSPPEHPPPPRPLYALLSLYRSGVGLSLLSCGYTPVGESVQPVHGKAGAWVRFNVSAPQQLLEQGIEHALFGLQAYAARRSPH